MGKANLSPLAPPQAATESLEIPVVSNSASQSSWRNLLSPKFIESGVLVADVLLIVAFGLLCSWAYQWVIFGKIENVVPYGGVGVLVAANFTALMAARQSYHLKRLILFPAQARDTVVIWSGTFAVLAVAAFTMKVSSDFSRGAVTLFFAGGLTMLLAWRRFVASRVLKSLADGSFVRKKIIVVAEHGQAVSSRPLNELLRYGFDPVRICEVSREEIASSGIPASLRAKLVDLIEVAKRERIEGIYVAVRWHHPRIVDGILDAIAVLPIPVHLVPDETAARFLNYPLANIGNTWTAVLRRTPLTQVELAAKRCIDLVLSTAALVTLLPLMVVTALLIKLDSRGPVFFLQKRNGFNDRTFNIFKFRTMHVFEHCDGVKQATRDDPRVTRLGRWLRKSSIDELPQLFNVIRGDMSLVGPRPHATSHNSEYEKVIANYAFRHHVKPGLTGWAQVNGFRGETRHVAQMERRVEHDLWYINNWSPWLDLRIVLWTVVVALRQDTAY
jgi:Undecaprenyl-phosphate glucose phosphotransferase